MSDRTKPSITIPAGDPPADLLIDDEIVGDGDEATIGKRVTVHYAGVAWSTGSEFDASWNRGVKGMKVGGRRRLTIPADLGYGSRGAGGVIKGGETLVFVVDLVSVR
jgi:peptidylprolyl isomerase